MTKPLNVGIIGYGFMGRTHSNAYRKVRNFFDVPYEPVLKTICGLEEKEAKAFADRWGYQSYTTDWHKVIDAYVSQSLGSAEICSTPICLRHSDRFGKKTPLPHG